LKEILNTELLKLDREKVPQKQRQIVTEAIIDCVGNVDTDETLHHYYTESHFKDKHDLSSNILPEFKVTLCPI